jgi:hypothetical protein
MKKKGEVHIYLTPDESAARFSPQDLTMAENVKSNYNSSMKEQPTPFMEVILRLPTICGNALNQEKFQIRS